MNLNDWRQQQHTGTDMTLPSGLEVKLRKVALLDLAERGRIPAPLVGMVNEMMQGGKKTFGLADFASFAEVINIVSAACIIDPPIAEQPDDEHLAITELPIADRLEVFNWANTEANKLAPFRAAYGEPASSERPGDGVQLPPQLDPGGGEYLDGVSG